MYVCMCVCMHVYSYVCVVVVACVTVNIINFLTSLIALQISLTPRKSPQYTIYRIPYTIYHIPYTSYKHLQLSSAFQTSLTSSIYLHLFSSVTFKTWTSCARTWRCRWDWRRESSWHLGHHCLEVQLSSTLAFSTPNVSCTPFLCIFSLLPFLSVFLYLSPLLFHFSLSLYISFPPLLLSFCFHRRETASSDWLCIDPRSNSREQLL